MAYPLSRLEVSIPAASFDGRYYGRYPHGDAPSGASFAAAANDSIASSAALTTKIQLASNASDTTSGNATLTNVSGGSQTLKVLFPQDAPAFSFSGPVYLTLSAVGENWTTLNWSGTGAPTGLSVSTDANGNGVLSGTPSATGTFTLVATATNPATGNYGQMTITCTVT